MEANQKKRFVCKFCNKRYPCGKSLGGHIRIHLNVSSTDVTEEANNQSNYVNHQGQGNVGGYDNGSNSSKREFSGPSGEALVAGQTSYGLRENPRKTKRFLFDLSNSNLLQDKVCKECGKGFQSLKALCGHMACHSRNNNHHQNLEDHYSVTSEKLKELVMDDQSDTETSAPTKRRRSERVKYNARCVYTSSGNDSLSTGSDMEQEQEEVAMCLMLLSRDSSFKGCFSSIGNSSDNTSVVLETKSSPAKSRRVDAKNVGPHHEFEDNLYLLMKKSKQQEEEVSMENENDELENSDSGYFRNGPNKVEFDPSHDVVGRNDEMLNGKAELGSGFCGRFDSEMGKRLSRFRRIKAELRKNVIEGDGDELADRGLAKNGFYNPELQKRGRTPSLGEQKVGKRKTNGFIYYSKNGGIDNGEDINNVPGSSKNIQPSTRKNPVHQSSSSKAEKKLGSRKGKMHECPFCSKVFRSGQALGGHKRSHFVGSAEDRTLVIKEDTPNIIPTLIDLNLPAPPEEEVGGFTPW